jgi:hypothetical protein
VVSAQISDGLGISVMVNSVTFSRILNSFRDSRCSQIVSNTYCNHQAKFCHSSGSCQRWSLSFLSIVEICLTWYCLVFPSFSLTPSCFSSFSCFHSWRFLFYPNLTLIGLAVLVILCLSQIFFHGVLTTFSKRSRRHNNTAFNSGCCV